jgi:hypothetical protein
VYDDDYEEEVGDGFGYWDFKLDGVEVGAKRCLTVQKLLSIRINIYRGPSETIGVLAQVNKVACFDLSRSGPDFCSWQSIWL